MSISLTALAAEPSFYFGVSNAAFQVEGSPQDSDWRKWTQTSYRDGTPHIWNHDNAERATDFWNLYDTDFKLAQDTGLNAFRLSVAWERIEPKPGQWNEAALDHYVDMIAAMRKRGLEPFVTLQHYVLPLWVSEPGGLTWNDYPARFGEFAAHVVKRLATDPKSHVIYFMTLNEPNIQVRFGYLDAHKFPPGIDNPNKAVEALAGLAKAHIEAVRAVRALGLKDVKMGLAHNWQVFEPLNKSSASDRKIADKIDWAFNRAFMEAITTGDIHFEMPHAKPHREKVKLPAGPMLDYLGINNYGRSFVTVSHKYPGYVLSDATGNILKNDLGWELVRTALHDSVKQASRYGFPLIVTETGVADSAKNDPAGLNDKMRQEYLRWNFDTIRQLRAEKVNLFGYIHWSLTDNFEWAYGLTPRFGLVRIDYKTMARQPRKSLAVYKELVAEYWKAHAGR